MYHNAIHDVVSGNCTSKFIVASDLMATIVQEVNLQPWHVSWKSDKSHAYCPVVL